MSLERLETLKNEFSNPEQRVLILLFEIYKTRVSQELAKERKQKEHAPCMRECSVFFLEMWLKHGFDKADVMLALKCQFWDFPVSDESLNAMAERTVRSLNIIPAASKMKPCISGRIERLLDKSLSYYSFLHGMGFSADLNLMGGGDHNVSRI